jgi:4-hydroxy-tetrahydrodipicolinate synthase
MGDSLYTPFCGPEGDEIDWSAYRQLVRYCVGALGHPLLWLTSGIAEFWALTLDERKHLLEIAIDEARLLNPDIVIQACTAATGPRDCLELTRHAQEAGADIAYIQTPPIELHGGEGALRFFQYVADRTDIALGIFNSPSSGYVLTPSEILAIYERVPAVCAIKDGSFQPRNSLLVAKAAPGLQVWECDDFALLAGWASQGFLVRSQLGTTGYLYDYPGDKRYSYYNELLSAGRIDDAIAYRRESGLAQFIEAAGRWMTLYPGRPDYFTHWGEMAKYTASLLGLPAGSWLHSRPPQALLPQAAKDQLKAAVEDAGLLGVASPHLLPTSRATTALIVPALKD